MPQIQAQQLFIDVEKAHKQQQFAGLYVFFGEENYLVQQAAQYVRSCSLDGVMVDFNFTIFYAGDSPADRILEDVQTLPMMSPRRVVMVRDIQEFKDKEWEVLAPVLEKPVDSTVLILTGSKLDKRKKYYRWLTEQGIYCEFRRPFENQIPGWIRQICSVHGLQIEDQALHLLHRLTGSVLSEIEAEVKKLREFLGTRTRVTLEDVAQCVSSRKEENVFALAATIAKGDTVESLLQLASLLEDGQSSVGIVALVARHIRILMMLRQGEEQGLTGQKLSAHAQIPHYYLGEYQNQARHWARPQLEAALISMNETDRALKSSPLSASIWLENMVMHLCTLAQVKKTGARSPDRNV
jgi:DNA polymerase-3 subunit delta